MNESELNWLIPTLLQVSGLAIGLTIIGFAYEHANRERQSLIERLIQGGAAAWMALAGVIFTAGLCFTHMLWVYKVIAILLSVLLIGLAVTAPRVKHAEIIKAPKPKRTVKSTVWLVTRIYLGVLLLLILAWGLNLSLHAVRLYGLAKSVRDNPAQIRKENLVSLVGNAAGEISAISNQLEPLCPIFNALQGLPIVGAYLGQIEPLLLYSDGLAQAGNEIIIGLQPILEEFSNSQTALSLPEQASLALQSGQDRFANASQAIEGASQARSRIRAELLPDSIKVYYLKLDDKFDLLVSGVKLLQVAPTLLGTGEAQKYLVLAQNRDELRATGGFISGIGLIIVQDGKILQFDLGDSYAIDDFSKGYPPPPEPLKRFMLADYWVTRDANWSPDFPTAARQAQALYTLSTGVETQGVIAFNQLVIQRILQVIGAVAIPGTDGAVTAENVEEFMRQAWAPAPEQGLSPAWWLHRKDFMKQLGSVILDRVLQTSDQQQLMDLASTLLDLLDEGQLLVYLNDPTAQATLEQGGWDGALRPGSADYLYLVDTNVGFNKVDSVVQRSLRYQVDLRDLEQPTGEVTLTYQHTGTGDPACQQLISYGNGTYQDMIQRCYLDYWRVYVPGGSELIDSTTRPVPAEELLNGAGWSGKVERLAGESGSQVLAGLLMLAPGETSQVKLTYRLPTSVVYAGDTALAKYNLSLQVQPGLNGIPCELEVKLPEGASVVDPGAGWKAGKAGSWTWQGTIDRATVLSLSLQLP